MTPFHSISDLAQRLRRRDVSPVEVTRTCLERIERLNPALNAFITVTAESALAEARRAEAEIGRGEWRGPLHGIPVALKDLIDTANVRTTAGSALHQDRVPPRDAEVVRRLRQAGAVIVGKNNLHEFAYGGSSLVSLLRRCAQSVGRGTHCGRIVGRIGCGSGCRTGVRGHWDGYGGIDSRAGFLVRVRGAKADLWTSFEPGSDSAFDVARSRGAAGGDRRRRGYRAAGNRGIRWGRYHFVRCPGRGLCWRFTRRREADARGRGA